MKIKARDAPIKMQNPEAIRYKIWLKAGRESMRENQ